MSMYPHTTSPSPLTQPELYVLLALAKEDNYAYGLRGYVMNNSLGAVNLTPGTLYPVIARLHDQGLIDMVGLKPAGHKERMFYAISESGIIRLKEELVRIQHLVKIAAAYGLVEPEIPLDIQRLLLDNDRLE